MNFPQPLPLVPCLFARTATISFTRYQLQQQVTNGMSSTTLKDIVRSQQRTQGLALEVIEFFPPFIVRAIVKNRFPLFLKNIHQLVEPIVTDWICQLVNHPISSMKQLQCTLN